MKHRAIAYLGDMQPSAMSSEYMQQLTKKKQRNNKERIDEWKK